MSSARPKCELEARRAIDQSGLWLALFDLESIAQDELGISAPPVPHAELYLSLVARNGRRSRDALLTYDIDEEGRRWPVMFTISPQAPNQEKFSLEDGEAHGLRTRSGNEIHLDGNFALEAFTRRSRAMVRSLRAPGIKHYVEYVIPKVQRISGTTLL